MAFDACFFSEDRWWNRSADRRGTRANGGERSAGRGRGTAREATSHADAALDELSEGLGGRVPSDLLCGLAEGLRVVDVA